MKFVIFDIDGTLANTKKVEDKCFMRAFEQAFNIDIWNQQWGALKNVTDWGITEEIVERELNRKPRPEEYDRMISTFVANLKRERNSDISQFSEVKGAKAFFNKLRKKENYHLGIATGSWERSAKIKLDTIGIDINGICFSNSDYHKSRGAITQDVINQLKKKAGQIPDKIVYLGDGEWDLKTCKKIGIEFIGIDIENDGKLRSLGAKMVFKDYTNSDEIMSQL